MDKARAVLTRALQEADVPAVWTEWDTGDPKCPADRTVYGSPTILVNGEDVAPESHEWVVREAVPACPRCRIYQEGSQTIGAPPLQLVQDAVFAAMAPDVV